MSDAVISVAGLRKAYDGHEAVRGIDLEVRAGEIYAFLGPNGAGKTTTVEILEGYRRRSAGEVRVLGVDPERATGDWRARIGVVLQSVEQDGLLSVRETLRGVRGLLPGAARRRPRRSRTSGWRSSATSASGACPAASSAGSTSGSR